MKNKEIEKLWDEKQHFESHSENSVLQDKEWDSIATAILKVSRETANLTAEDMEAVNWAKSRLGV